MSTSLTQPLLACVRSDSLCSRVASRTCILSTSSARTATTSPSTPGSLSISHPPRSSHSIPKPSRASCFSQSKRRRNCLVAGRGTKSRPLEPSRGKTLSAKRMVHRSKRIDRRRGVRKQTGRRRDHPPPRMRFTPLPPSPAVPPVLLDVASLPSPLRPPSAAARTLRTTSTTMTTRRRSGRWRVGSRSAGNGVGSGTGIRRLRSKKLPNRLLVRVPTIPYHREFTPTDTV